MLDTFIIREYEELKRNQLLLSKDREEAIKKLEFRYNIKPISIKRTNNFKTNTKKSNIISAYEIREFLNKNESIKEYKATSTSTTLELMEENDLQGVELPVQKKLIRK